ncbi:hypothetical protein RvY_12305 [Ramazzottius varieornatus]|uniref:Uncharacterized protein n=1 Tax=Ramazzottius varieornatus TaxID=947166 RepID=A0A1D1VSS8_RAMVA|nr:hypothetical protein RvY_12305 [Ramazzottius varieornatus]
MEDAAEIDQQGQDPELHGLDVDTIFGRPHLVTQTGPDSRDRDAVITV